MEQIVENKKMGEGEFKMIVKTHFGLEEVLAKELLRLGGRDIEIHNRAVSVVGDIGFLYKANLGLRTALRILKPIFSFEVQNEESLYQHIKEFAWENLITTEQTLAVDCVLNTDIFTHSYYIALKTKDAIVDRFREKFDKRPSVDTADPDLRINIHVFRTTCSVSLDSSGSSLHKRGYREETGEAPINEVLAAGLLMLSGWERHQPLIDPMCGSGTFLIEAAMYANNIPAGYFRKSYGFMKWNDFNRELWDTIFESSVNKIKNDDYVKIFGCDILENMANKASENVRLANVDDVVSVSHSSFHDFNPPQARGVVIMNPPYGERIGLQDINEFYKSIGDTLKSKYSGYDAWIISSSPEGFKSVGLRPSRKITVFNGSLECRFMKFEMYQGTKKIHKLINK
jgi:putative N6-adenine-specific DNA methylase